MATPSIVGIRQGDHWHGTFVGYDGGLESLGTKLIDLVLALRGDLDAVWSRIASPPDGWRRAFSEPYENGLNVEYFATGRTEPPLLTDQDPFVRQNAVYWYIFDLEARALNIYGVPAQGNEWPLVRRIGFSTDGRPQFQDTPENGGERNLGSEPHRISADEWVASMNAAYADHAPELIDATSRRIQNLLKAELPIVGRRTTLTLNVDHSVTLAPEGLQCPLMLFISGGPDPSVPTDLVDHPSYLLFPRRVMSDGARCEAALGSALGRISLEIGLAKVPVLEVLESNAVFSALFPFHVLDRSLDAPAQDAAIKAEVKKAFRLVS